MNLKKIAAIIACVMTIGTSSVFAHAVDKKNVYRIYGQNRYETATKISKQGWEKSSYAIVCRGDNFADALSSVPLAKKYNAPILLISKDKVDENVKSEIKRLGVENIFIIGGQGVINKHIENEIKNISKVKTVHRLGGKDRYETSMNIGKSVGIKDQVVLVSGTSSADALSISSIAASKNIPIVLTDNNKEKLNNYIKSHNVKKAFLIGGEKCVSKDIENMFSNKERIYGKDRYETNENILRRFSNELNFNKVYIALSQSQRGDEFADALSSSALAAKHSNPIVLVYKDINNKTKYLLKDRLSKESSLIILGGEKLISNSIVEDLIYKEDSEKHSHKNKTTTSSSSSSSSSSGGKTTVKNKECSIKLSPSFPGAFTYDVKVISNKEAIVGYKLLYDGKVIAEDKDRDGVVRPLSIFLAEDADKSKIKLIKDEKELKVTSIDIKGVF